MEKIILAMKKVFIEYANKYDFDECTTKEETFWGNLLLESTDIENILCKSNKKKGSIDMDNFWGNPRLCIRSYEETGFEDKETLVSIVFKRDGSFNCIQAYNEKGLELAIQLKNDIEKELERMK